MNTLGSMETLKVRMAATGPGELVGGGGGGGGGSGESDVSSKMKEEETKRLEGLIMELGKGLRKLLDGSDEHDVRAP